MLDLETAILAWRARFRASNAFTAADIDELEAHLRDAIDAHVAAGRPLDEAFRLASERLGDTVALAPEFEAKNRATAWASRAAWSLAGALVASPLLRAVLGAPFASLRLGAAAGASDPGALGRAAWIGTWAAFAGALLVVAAIAWLLRRVEARRGSRALERGVFAVAIVFALLAWTGAFQPALEARFPASWSVDEMNAWYRGVSVLRRWEHFYAAPLAIAALGWALRARSRGPRPFWFAAGAVAMLAFEDLGALAYRVFLWARYGSASFAPDWELACRLSGFLVPVVGALGFLFALRRVGARSAWRRVECGRWLALAAAATSALGYALVHAPGPRATSGLGPQPAWAALVGEAIFASYVVALVALSTRAARAAKA